MTVLEALQALVALEHQVVYGYGVVGAHLTGSDRAAALRRLELHEAARDELAALVAGQGLPAPQPSPAYALPFAVDSASRAARLAAQLEDATAGGAWDLIAATAASSQPRRLGVTLLDRAAAWSARWHGLVGSAAPALPGRPAA